MAVFEGFSGQGSMTESFVPQSVLLLALLFQRLRGFMSLCVV